MIIVKFQKAWVVFGFLIAIGMVFYLNDLYNKTYNYDFQFIMELLVGILFLVGCIVVPVSFKIKLDEKGIENIGWIKRQKYRSISWENVARVYSPIDKNIIPVIVVEGISDAKVKSLFFFTFFNTNLDEVIRYILERVPKNSVDGMVVKMLKNKRLK